MNQSIWTDWVNNWNWILSVAERRNWDNDPLIIKPTVDISTIEQLENDLAIKYPVEFKHVLTEYSSGVLLNWQIQGEETENEFREVFCGGGRGYLWDFESLKSDYEGYKLWLSNCFSNEEDEYDKIWHNSVPFLDVPNGDIIAFDTSQRERNCPVVYLSHDGSDFHGHRLAEDFIDFISRWSNLGCIGTEGWQFEPFYDYDMQTLKANGLIIDKWKMWLDK